MDNILEDLTEIYKENFVSSVEHYTSAEQQAAQFKIVNILQNIKTNETTNSIIVTNK